MTRVTLDTTIKAAIVMSGLIAATVVVQGVSAAAHEYLNKPIISQEMEFDYRATLIRCNHFHRVKQNSLYRSCVASFVGQKTQELERDMRRAAKRKALKK